MKPAAKWILSAVLGAVAWSGAFAQGPTAVGEQAARSVARLALVDLRMREEPTPGDYALAEAVLSIAQERAPTDVELLRKRIEAAFNAGDGPRTVELTRELVRLDPADTVAQLRLITSGISRLNTTDERLDLYDRFLSDRGRSLDPTVRSRLALDAALLRREIGDNDGFVRLLEMATALDSTHKEAATLAATFYAASVDDARGRAELLSNLLFADPLDPNIHLSLARELAAGGAFASARRFHTAARSILEAARTQPRVDQVVNSLALSWLVEGPAVPVEELNKRLSADREQVRREVFQRYGDNPDPSAPRPQDVRLATEFELVRILAASAAGDARTLDLAMGDYERSQGDMVKKLSDPQSRPPGMTPTEAQDAIRNVAIDVQLVRLWSGGHVETALSELASSGMSADAADPGERMVFAMYSARSGKSAEAIASLEGKLDIHPIARIAIGIALEEAGRKEEAAAMYREVAARQAMGLEGAWARGRAEALGAYSPTDRAIAEQLEAIGKAIPSWLDEMARDPHRFVSLTCEVLEATTGAIAPARVRIRIRNLAEVPLALGPDRAINSRILLTPRLGGDAEYLATLARPEVVELDRRLRLMPREAIDVVIPADQGFTGLLMEVHASRATRLRWRAIQGFVMGPNGSYMPGPMCLSTESAIQVRAPLDAARLPHDALMARLGSMGDEDAAELASAIRTRLLDPAAPTPDDAQAAAIAVAIAERYPALSVEARLVLAATLPPATLAPVMAVVDGAILEDGDPDVLAVGLVSRVRRADHPLLARAAESGDVGLARIALGVRDAIERGSRGIARDDLLSALRPEPSR